jgi:post-segregation antitoxin (ccd killing protein)
MAKTSIYLPDDLAEQVRAYGIPVSEVAQTALRQAVKDAEIKGSIMTNIQAVADRMKGIIAAETETKGAEIRKLGTKWARESATAGELEYLATYDKADGFNAPISLVMYLDTGAPFGPSRPYWAEFQNGAREVWGAVQPLLTEMDNHGFTVPVGSGGYSGTVTPEYQLWLLREPAPDAPLAEHERKGKVHGLHHLRPARGAAP